MRVELVGDIVDRAAGVKVGGLAHGERRAATGRCDGARDACHRREHLERVAEGDEAAEAYRLKQIVKLGCADIQFSNSTP